jgi:hypothetical protein
VVFIPFIPYVGYFPRELGGSPTAIRQRRS